MTRDNRNNKVAFESLVKMKVTNMARQDQVAQDALRATNTRNRQQRRAAMMQIIGRGQGPRVSWEILVSQRAYRRHLYASDGTRGC